MTILYTEGQKLFGFSIARRGIWVLISQAVCTSLENTRKFRFSSLSARFGPFSHLAVRRGQRCKFTAPGESDEMLNYQLGSDSWSQVLITRCRILRWSILPGLLWVLITKVAKQYPLEKCLSKDQFRNKLNTEPQLPLEWLTEGKIESLARLQTSILKLLLESEYPTSTISFSKLKLI